MIDRKKLLDDAKKQVKALEADLLDVTREGTEIGTALRAEYQAAFAAKRTGWSDKEWIDDRIAQAAVAWVLACVFVRFLEDNELVADARITGPDARGRHARDVKDHYFRDNPAHSDADYLKWVFEQVAKYPATASVFDKQHNPLWQLPISGDAARELIAFWRKIDPTSDNALVHDFTDDTLDTRFLGDLYQDLSDHAKKTYALLQTPEFVEEFILDRTLDPAIEEFGLDETTLIDPTCGSGHFLLGAFHRLLERWRAQEPGTDARELVQRSLHAVHGVDINPFAVAIAKFRLMIAATIACDIKRASDAPAFELNLAVGDSLLHGHVEQRLTSRDASDATAGHWYQTEDAGAALKILDKRYSAVVGNPPYITPKDPSLNQKYRDRFSSCHREYALSVPFMELFFRLAWPYDSRSSPGFVGKITAASFAKQQFGTKLVQSYLPTVDLTHVIDSSRSYIPGHIGTPTVILFGRARRPSSELVRVVLGIRGDSTLPEDPATGEAWLAAASNVDAVGYESEFVSVVDLPRVKLASHPWSLEGGGMPQLLSSIRSAGTQTVGDVAAAIGCTSIAGEDDCFELGPTSAAIFRRATPYVLGDVVREWTCVDRDWRIFPYDDGSAVEFDRSDREYQWLWPRRTYLLERKRFGIPVKNIPGFRWWEWREFYPEKLSAQWRICFAEVATHNHFVLDSGGRVFKQSAPVIAMSNVSDELVFGVLGILNSSVACLLLKQSAQTKSPARIGQPRWKERYQFNSTKVGELVLPESLPSQLGRAAAKQSEVLMSLSGQSRLFTSFSESLARADEGKREWQEAFEQLVFLQEEIDWFTYGCYDIVDDQDLVVEPSSEPTPYVRPGQRAFEIELAQRTDGDDPWFRLQGIEPSTGVPSNWPAWYRSIVVKRIELIRSHPEISVLERPEYKRRWAIESWEARHQQLLERWLLGRLEDPGIWSDARALSCARLADLLFSDSDVQAAAELWAGGDVDPVAAVMKLVADQSVPYLSQLRYKDSGLATRAVWERTWNLQRQEDVIDAEGLNPAAAEAKRKRVVGEIAKPPAYKSTDFHKPSYWKLRGKLDVPKERFISYPGVETVDDPSPVIGWAGWNHEERAQAIGALIDDRERSHAWEGERLIPLVAGLRELLPWVKQWHAEVDPVYGTSAADDFAQLYESKLHEHGLTESDLDAWRPPASTRGRRARTSA